MATKEAVVTLKHVPLSREENGGEECGFDFMDTSLDASQSQRRHDMQLRHFEGKEKEDGEVTIHNGLHDCCCDKTWVGFTQDTTLHGLKYIWLQDAFIFRRLLWLSLTLCCSAIMMYQILDRIIYFSTNPVTVDVRMNFNTSLTFPSLTFCNQNAFRASRAAELGHYELLTDMYDDGRPFRSRDLQSYGASNVSWKQLYMDTRHRLEDLLISCRWRGRKCGLNNFQLVATDHGMCYQLDSSNLTVDSAGADDGLSLTLNVEQYEYMPGPHDAAGVKVLLHDRKEFPRVHALGQALSAGVHSFVAVKLVSVENLPSPHGECGSPSLTYFSQYETANCEAECSATLLHSLCGCKLVFMPGQSPVCTLWQYYTCYVPQKQVLRQQTVDQCQCPVPCSFLVFDPVVSYADVSPLLAERLLADTNLTTLTHHFSHAREVTHRLQREKRQLFQGHVLDLTEKLGRLQICLQEVLSRLGDQQAGVNSIHDQVQEVYNTTIYLYRYQQYIVEKDFVRAADAMSERTFRVVASGMQEFVNKVESRISQLTDANVSNDDARQAIMLQAVTDLDSKIDIANRALDNCTELYQAIETGTPIFNYKFRAEPRAHSVFIVPLPLFRYALNRTRSIRRRTRQVATDLQDIISNASLYKNLTLQAFQTRSVNHSAVSHANIYFLKSCREYLQSIDMFLNDGLRYTVAYMDKRFATFSQMWKAFEDGVHSLAGQLVSLDTLAQGVEDGIFLQVTLGLNMSRAFLEDGREAKGDVARLFLSPDLQLGQSDLKKFFAELRTRGQEVNDLWRRLQRESQVIVSNAFKDRNLQTYYDFKDVFSHLGDLTQALQTLAEQYDGYREADIRDAIKHYDDEFMTSLEDMVTHLRGFTDRGKIDTTFIRNNFLRLNVFYRELNYEQITQQEAYDIFALLCDIGGSMGLFLGASVLTIFEVLDLFIFQYLRAHRHRRRSVS